MQWQYLKQQVQKQLNMRYSSPPLPVDLHVANTSTNKHEEANNSSNSSSGQSTGTKDDEMTNNMTTQTDLFRSMALAHGMKFDL